MSVPKSANPVAGSIDPAEALKAEEARLRLLATDPPREIFNISDLHLGFGRQPATGRYARTENFLADQTLSRFLEYAGPNRQKLFVINGDAFDFVRVCSCPTAPGELQEWSDFLKQLKVEKSPADLKNSISKKELRFGLETNDYKSVWKLLQIANGHREFFQALAGWVNQGGQLLFSKGNHDLELYWPLVRQALAALLKRDGAAEDALQERLFYCNDSVLIGNIHFEHGHKYDSQQRIEGGPVLADTPDQLTLPLGLFVNRYLLNPLEKLEPFLGAMRPAERVLWMLLRTHPIAALGVLFRSLSFIRRAFQSSRIRDFFWYAVFIGSIAVPFLTALLGIGIFVFARSGQIFSSYPGSSSILGVLGIFAPYSAAAFREFVRNCTRLRKHPVGEDDYAQGVYGTLKAADFPRATQIYAVMGHTHYQDIQALPDLNGAKVLYLNTGTWIPIWPDDRPDLNGQVLFPFVHFQRNDAGEYRHQYCEWRDDRGAPAESYILDPLRV